MAKLDEQTSSQSDDFKWSGQGDVPAALNAWMEKIATGSKDNFRNNNFNKGSRPLDDKRIDKKINDILETEIVEKENQRDYSTRVNYKARNSKNDELKQNKSSKSKRFNGHEEYDEGKLKNLKQVDKLSHMFNEQDGEMLDYYDLTTERGKRT